LFFNPDSLLTIFSPIVYLLQAWGGLVKYFYLQRYNIYAAQALATVSPSEASFPGDGDTGASARFDIKAYYAKLNALGKAFQNTQWDPAQLPSVAVGDAVQLSAAAHAKYHP